MKKIFLTLFVLLTTVSNCVFGLTGYWAANSSMPVNNVSSPVLRSAVVSPIAAGAGHIAGGTAAGLFQGQKFGEAFANSFRGIGQSMAIGVATTIGVSYANGRNPWTGKESVSKVYRVVSEAEYADIQNNGIRVNPDNTGYQEGKLFYTYYEDALRGQTLFQKAYGQTSIIIEISYPTNVVNNAFHFTPDGINAIFINSLDLNKSIIIKSK
jgi:hypothetical protein